MGNGIDIVQGGTSQGYAGNDARDDVLRINKKKKKSLNVPMMDNCKEKRKNSLDEHAVDTQGYIAHDDDDLEDELQDEIRTKGFIKGSMAWSRRLLMNIIS